MTVQPPSLVLSMHMKDLLEDPSRCKIVATHFEDLDKILSQIQVDITNESNRDHIGPTILGIKHIRDTLLLFKAKGDALIQQENQKDAKASR